MVILDKDDITELCLIYITKWKVPKRHHVNTFAQLMHFFGIVNIIVFAFQPLGKIDIDEF